MTTRAPRADAPDSLDIAELHVLHDLLTASSAAIHDRLAQPRVTDRVCQIALQLITPLDELADALIDEVRVRTPASRRDVEMKLDLVVRNHLRAGEIEEATAASAEFLRAWRATARTAA